MPSPCVPDNLPIGDLPWRAILPLAGRANATLARYDGMLQTLPNPAVLLSPITANEAVLSSKIEGTQATLDEVFEADAGVVIPESRRGDIEEVTNYRIAVGIAEEALRDRAITLSLVREVHQRLMRGVRGRDKEPGRFRTDQNWIGRRGDPIERARFIPPSPALLPAELDGWQAYVALDDEDPTLQAAIAHAQFEILHPFKDGNGRIGRMLIPLILYRRRALSRPMFYMSEQLEANRSEYYDRLLAITTDGDWEGWLRFFLRLMIAQAEGNLDKVRRIRDLYDATRRAVVDVTHSQYAMAIVDAFFERPIISSKQFAQAAKFNNRVTANNMLRQLESAGIVKRIRDGGGRTPAIFAFPDLLDLAEGRTVFDGSIT